MSTDKPVITEIPVRIPKFAIVVIAALLVSIVSLVLLQQFTQPPANSQDESDNSVPAAHEIVPGKALTVNANAVTVYVPPNAINLSGSIFITHREHDLFPSDGQPEWTRPQVVDVEFLNTEGTPVPNTFFSMPIQICFQLAQEQWKNFSQHPGNYEVQYYAADGNPPSWQVLPMATYSDLSLLCGETYHFSLFALAVRLDTSIPVTGPTPTGIPTIVFPTPAPTDIPTDQEGDSTIINTSTPVPTVIPPSNPTNTSGPVIIPTSQPTNTSAPIVVPTSQPTNTPRPVIDPTDQPTDPPAPTQEDRPPRPTHEPKPTKTSKSGPPGRAP